MTVGRKFIQLILFAICLSYFVFNKAAAQQKQPDNTRFQDSLVHKLVYIYAEQLPEPKGGMTTLFKQVTKKLKFPAGDADYAGRVIVAFVIEPDGKIDGERVIRDPSGNQQIFSKQIFQIIKTIKWRPARRNGKAVPFLYTLPISIDITE
ncbi:energy transducer TonB [Mucilaginibacter flavidus]|uniref:energy transducer TonB n=1 Tax=Mucilaginibacter flavidus TaxID=2949309 RepID=UPI002093AEF4|nr:energy transducer TonB [Mucilaginibacter flavidus]MCO5949663.1 energy transducer TonB [Mucilaginibacter flavidus]